MEASRKGRLTMETRELNDTIDSRTEIDNLLCWEMDLLKSFWNFLNLQQRNYFNKIVLSKLGELF